jgi:hypothetical protein
MEKLSAAKTSGPGLSCLETLVLLNFRPKGMDGPTPSTERVSGGSRLRTFVCMKSRMASEGKRRYRDTTARTRAKRRYPNQFLCFDKKSIIDA